MSLLEDAIKTIAIEKSREFLCSQIVKNQKFTKKLVPDPFGTYKLLTDIQTSFLQGALKCGDEIDEEQVFGSSSAFSGGQCEGIQYQVDVQYTASGVNPLNGWIRMFGPIARYYQVANSGNQMFRYTRTDNPGVELIPTQNGNPSSQFGPWTGTFTSGPARLDGQADNCGDPPGTPGQIDEPYENLPSLPIEETTVNYDLSFDFGGNIGEQTIQLPFSNLRVDELIPFQFSFDVGGQRFTSNDEVTEPEPSAKSEEKDKGRADKRTHELLEDLQTELKKIEDCVCEEQPNIELEAANLPIALCSGSEGDRTAQKVFRTLQVLKDSVDAALIAEFDTSADLGLDGCVCDNAIAQGNAMEIVSGSITDRNSVVYSPELNPEVRAVVLSINNYDRLHTRVYRMAGEEVEGDFGWMAVSIDQFASGGHVTRLVSKETYLRLPDSTKPLRVRLSLRKGTDYTLWDTGERGKLRLPPAA